MSDSNYVANASNTSQEIQNVGSDGSVVSQAPDFPIFGPKIPRGMFGTSEYPMNTYRYLPMFAVHDPKPWLSKPKNYMKERPVLDMSAPRPKPEKPGNMLVSYLVHVAAYQNPVLAARSKI